MADKKMRIQLQFNPYDFRHMKALELLKAQPRHMTDLVVNAILHFESCPNSKIGINEEFLRKLIKDEIHNMILDGSLAIAPRPAPMDDEPPLGDMMAAFRG